MRRMARRVRSVAVLGTALLWLGTVCFAVEGSWTIRTVAGGGPDRIPAIEVNLDTPVAVAYGADGSLYVSAAWAHRVYKVDPAGQITIFAGSGGNRFYGGSDGLPATEARLYFPMGLAVDGTGNVYLAESGNNRVRKVDAATGIISTVAGNGQYGSGGDQGPATSAQLQGPSGVAVDLEGNLYIVEQDGCRVRKVDAATGVITAFAGSGVCSYGGDQGPATAATLYLPTYVTVDSSGNVFISDTVNNRLRRVDASTGIITSIAGPGLPCGAGVGPAGLALDGSGRLYFSTGNSVIRLDLQTGLCVHYVGDGRGFGGDGSPANGSVPILFHFDNGPGGLALDANGNLFIADTDNHRVRRVGSDFGIVSTVAGNGNGGSSGDSHPATRAALSYPTGAESDAQGNLYIADSGAVRKVDRATGIISTVAGNGKGGSSGDGGPALEASLSPDRILLDREENICVVENGYNRVRRIDSLTGIITTVAGTGEYGSGGDGGPATGAQLALPTGIAFDPSGNLYIAESGDIDEGPGGFRIRRVDHQTGTISTVAGTGEPGFSGDGGPALAAMLGFPADVATDAAGDLYITDAGNQRVRRVDAVTGIITTIAGTGQRGNSDDGGPALLSPLSDPDGITADASGNVYFTEGNFRVRRVDAASGIITTVAGSLPPSPDGRPWTGFAGDGGPASSAQLDFPNDVSLDAQGSLLIADDFNFRIRKVEAPANHPPVANAGADVRTECASPAGATVTLDGTGSGDPDSTPGTRDDIVSYVWLENYGAPAQALLGTGETLSVTLPLGSHAITLRVTDHAGATGVDSVTVMVVDTTPPTISVRLTPSVLWPPNHQMMGVTAAVTAADACSGSLSVVLFSVSGCEPADIPALAEVCTADDIQGAEIGTADFSFLLRAERGGRNSDRTYRAVYKATDAAGLSTSASATVLVPHDRRRASRSSRGGPFDPRP